MKSSGSQAPLAVPVRILLVDDNRLGLVARKRVLEEVGHSITTASEGEEALALFQGGEFDLLITDYKMPKMDGLQLIRQVRQINAKMPVILISGFTEALGLTEQNTGADLVLAKSANEVSQLIRAVSRVLRRAVPKKPPASLRYQLKAGRSGV